MKRAKFRVGQVVRNNHEFRKIKKAVFHLYGSTGQEKWLYQFEGFGKVSNSVRTMGDTKFYYPALHRSWRRHTAGL